MSAALSTIVIESYHGCELLRNCLDSLLNSPLEKEIIVADHALPGGSLAPW
jgi:GT2 family glycosyltransferase